MHSNSARSFLAKLVNIHLTDGSVIASVRVEELKKRWKHFRLIYSVHGKHLPDGNVDLRRVARLCLIFPPEGWAC